MSLIIGPNATEIEWFFHDEDWAKLVARGLVADGYTTTLTRVGEGRWRLHGTRLRVKVPKTGPVDEASVDPLNFFPTTPR